MKALAILNILCAIFAPLHCSSGVKCKKGRFMKLNGEGRTANKTCPTGEDRCFAAICTAWDQPGNDVIYWDCVGPDYEFKRCGLMRGLAAEFTKSENTSCQCPVGEKGVNMTNVAFQLPPEPTTAKKRLQCKVGYFNATGYGNATIGNCFGGYEHFYAASCAKVKLLWCELGNKHERTVFGCANGTSCAAINAKEGKEMNSMVNCKCLFGKAGVDMSNKNLTPLSIMPTTTPATTTTSKPTTTTTVKTLATTTVKPATKTAKPFGTMDKAKMTTVEEPTTTMEENRSARRSVATFCTVLIAIGILASSHSLFGGHHFNTFLKFEERGILTDII
ncbi:hypothetical protein GPALN_004179 [Globodera pallida]|nr:hypothetical protein GPALN_004179 [Globodera pallida]